MNTKTENLNVTFHNSMLSVQEAMDIILCCKRDYGNETCSLDEAAGRVLADDLRADRDIPPYDRVAMDGIAIQYKSFGEGNRQFRVKGIQAAGGQPLHIDNPRECIEIMTGAALPHSADTVIRYEDIEIRNGIAFVQVDNIKKGQNIHRTGKDKTMGEIVCRAGTIIDPVIISIASSVGASSLLVKKTPKVMIISTGNEIVEPGAYAGPYQIRSSNRELVKEALKSYKMNADLLHIKDEREDLTRQLSYVLNDNDVVIISGGVSKGKYDFIPTVLTELSVKNIFHKVKQKPGKPFWFGMYKERTLVFAFPGNPVSTTLCLYRYFIPWLQACLGLQTVPVFARLKEELCIASSLTYFLPVFLQMEGSCLNAIPIDNNGSGDFVSLAEASAFIELPAGIEKFSKEEDFPVWMFHPFLYNRNVNSNYNKTKCLT
jgi:molybdopterin molybdotransferase